MKNLFSKANFNLIKEQRFTYVTNKEKGREGPGSAEGKADIQNEAYLALDRVARYREELNKRLNNLDPKHPKYKIFEKTYNELTDVQERLEKNLTENDSKKQVVISESFNKINRIFTNPHLNLLRSVMISRQLKEIKK